jgi:hypothetical protein
MKPYESLAIIGVNSLLFASIVTAHQPRQINTDIFGQTWGSVEWGWARLDGAIAAANDKAKARLNQIEKETPVAQVCSPEFEPIALSDATSLPEPRTIEKVIKELGQPCLSDGEKIYYATDTGQSIFFDKSTGKGGFQE